jgi:hypothetical protein
MTGRALRSAVVVALALLIHAEPVGAAETPTCPSFGELTRRLDAKINDILALQPGVALEEFTRKYASQALNFWDDVGVNKDTVFIVGVKDGNAQVTDQLVCLFDRSDRLLSCQRECCRYTTRTITEAQYNSIKPGETRAGIERRLCSASDSEVDPKNARRVSIYYHIDLPVDHHDEGQTVMLVFESGTLTSKGMSPYY